MADKYDLRFLFSLRGVQGVISIRDTDTLMILRPTRRSRHGRLRARGCPSMYSALGIM
jgi:hypothetical protein